MQPKYILIGAGVAAVAIMVIVAKKDALGGMLGGVVESVADAGVGIGEAAGGFAVDVAGGVATGVLDGISVGIGIPTTKETITDAQECRIYMNEFGYWKALGKCSAGAFNEALFMD